MSVKIQMVALRSIVPNRHRHIERYKLDPVKVATLIASYEASGFWDGSIQGRPLPEDKSKVEVAFGHHRVEAAKQARLGEIGIAVSDLDEATMLKMMAFENHSDFKHDATVAVETIAAVIEAYGAGSIELEPVPKDGPKGSTHEIFPSGKIYSLATVARFLGWVKPSTKQATSACAAAFAAYHEREAVDIAKDTLAPDERSEVAVQSVVQASAMARKAAKREHAGRPDAEKRVREAAREAAHAQAKAVKKAGGGFAARQEARRSALGAVYGSKVPPKALPSITHAAERVTIAIDSLLERDGATWEKVKELAAAYADPAVECPKRVINLLETALGQLADRAQRLGAIVSAAKERRER